MIRFAESSNGNSRPIHVALATSIFDIQKDRAAADKWMRNYFVHIWESRLVWNTQKATAPLLPTHRQISFDEQYQSRYSEISRAIRCYWRLRWQIICRFHCFQLFPCFEVWPNEEQCAIYHCFVPRQSGSNQFLFSRWTSEKKYRLLRSPCSHILDWSLTVTRRRTNIPLQDLAWWSDCLRSPLPLFVLFSRERKTKHCDKKRREECVWNEQTPI